MTQPRTLILEERGDCTVLVGGWPEKALIDPFFLPELSPEARTPKLGDDFTIQVANGKAVYRYVDHTEREMVCIRIR